MDEKQFDELMGEIYRIGDHVRLVAIVVGVTVALSLAFGFFVFLDNLS